MDNPLPYDYSVTCYDRREVSLEPSNVARFSIDIICTLFFLAVVRQYPSPPGGPVPCYWSRAHPPGLRAHLSPRHPPSGALGASLGVEPPPRFYSPRGFSIAVGKTRPVQQQLRERPYDVCSSAPWRDGDGEGRKRVARFKQAPHGAGHARARP